MSRKTKYLVLGDGRTEGEMKNLNPTQFALIEVIHLIGTKLTPETD